MALKPITRQEQIIAGKDLEPITRMERFLKEYGGGGEIEEPIQFVGKDLTCSIPFEEIYALSKNEIEERAVYAYKAPKLEEAPSRCIFVKKAANMTEGKYVDLVFVNDCSGDYGTGMTLGYQGVHITKSAMSLFDVT